MSQLTTQAFACFDLADTSVNEDQLFTHLQDVINSEVRSDSFDAETAYAPFADAFNVDDAFDPFYEGEVDFDEYFQMQVERGFVVLEGVPLLNEDDHVTRWVAWILFRQFGAGDVLSFSNETFSSEGISRCFYEVSRQGQVTTKVSYTDHEDDC